MRVTGMLRLPPGTTRTGAEADGDLLVAEQREQVHHDRHDQHRPLLGAARRLSNRPSGVRQRP
jgi:hypothetical protein